MKKIITVVSVLILLTVLLSGCAGDARVNVDITENIAKGDRYVKVLESSVDTKVNINIESDKNVDLFFFGFYGYEKFIKEEKRFAYFPVGTAVNVSKANLSFSLQGGKWFIVVDNSNYPCFGAESLGTAKVHIKISTEYILSGAKAPKHTPTNIWTAEDIEGNDFSLGDYIGKVLIINFMQVSNEPADSIAQLYNLCDVFEEYSENEVGIVSVEVADKKSRPLQKVLDNFEKSHDYANWTFTLDNILIEEYNEKRNAPYIVFIVDGTLFYSCVGVQSYATISEKIIEIRGR